MNIPPAPAGPSWFPAKRKPRAPAHAHRWEKARTAPLFRPSKKKKEKPISVSKSSAMARRKARKPHVAAPPRRSRVIGGEISEQGPRPIALCNERCRGLVPYAGNNPEYAQGHHGRAHERLSLSAIGFFFLFPPRPTATIARPPRIGHDPDQEPLPKGKIEAAFRKPGLPPIIPRNSLWAPVANFGPCARARLPIQSNFLQYVLDSSIDAIAVWRRAICPAGLPPTG